MLTIPIVARFHRLEESSSAVATLKCARRRSFKLRTTCRLSFKDWACSMRRSRVSEAIISPCRGSRSFSNQESLPRRPSHHHFRRDALGDKGLDHIPYLNIAVVGDGDTTFHAVRDLADIVLKAPQRANLALEHDHVIAQQAHFRIAFDQAIGDATTSNRTHFRNAEGFKHLGSALIGLFDCGL